RRRPAFHLKLDTGMHRQGFQEHELVKLIAALKRFHLDPAGIYSHFAAEDNKKFSSQQIALFEKSIAAFRASGVNSGIRHLSRTGGVVNYPEANYDLVRIGLGLYGYLPELGKTRRRAINLHPILTWKTIVGEVKRVKKGERIGYGLTERLKRDSTIAILPIGYWHGLNRGLSGIGEVLIHGQRAKVMGRVSMDMTAIDVTDIPGIKVGGEVVLIGRQGRDFISADQVAQKLGTISYEVLTRTNPLIERIVV
ncbi:MAG: alanine racemase, partial [Patescibacteria group bacterium]